LVRITEKPDRLDIVSYARFWMALGTIIIVVTPLLMLLSILQGNYSWGFDFSTFQFNDSYGAGFYFLLFVFSLGANAFVCWDIARVHLDRSTGRAAFSHWRPWGVARIEVPLASVKGVAVKRSIKDRWLVFLIEARPDFKLPSSPFDGWSQWDRAEQRIHEWMAAHGVGEQQPAPSTPAQVSPEGAPG
jgi:hypothetical protein